MTIERLGSPSDSHLHEPNLKYCPRCGQYRAGQLPLCAYCRHDFETPMPGEITSTGPPIPLIRIVPVDAPPPPGTWPLGQRTKRWLLLGPIALL